MTMRCALILIVSLQIDLHFYRPIEVKTFMRDPSKAKQKTWLGS
jgi:GDP-D-mannose dehydratase